MNQRHPFEVGQEVIVRDVNENRLGGPKRGTVVKVGRTLVTVQEQYGQRRFSIQDRTVRDNYGHASIQTVEEYEDQIARTALLRRLREHGLDEVAFRPQLPTTTLAKVVEMLDAAAAETKEG